MSAVTTTQHWTTSERQRTCSVSLWLARLHQLWREIGVSQLQVQSCGTAFQLNCDKLTLAFNDLSSY